MCFWSLCHWGPSQKVTAASLLSHAVDAHPQPPILVGHYFPWPGHCSFCLPLYSSAPSCEPGNYWFLLHTLQGPQGAGGCSAIFYSRTATPWSLLAAGVSCPSKFPPSEIFSQVAIFKVGLQRLKPGTYPVSWWLLGSSCLKSPLVSIFWSPSFLNTIRKRGGQTSSAGTLYSQWFQFLSLGGLLVPGSGCGWWLG